MSGRNSRRRKAPKKKSSTKGGASVFTGSSALTSQADDRNNTRTHDPRFRKDICLSGLREIRNVFPSSWRTTMTGTITGQIAIGGAATRTFTVDVAGVYYPFDTATPWPTPLVAVNAYLPSGYNGLLATGSTTGPYSSYRTVGSAISVVLTPLSTLDACTVLVFPAVTGPTNFTAASQGRWVKKIEAVANEPNRVTNSISVAAVSGDTPLGVVTSSGFAAAFNASPSLGAEWEIWLNFAAVNVAAVTYTCTVVYDVILENPEYDLSEVNDLGIPPRVRKEMNAQKAKADKESKARSVALAVETLEAAEGDDLLSSSSSSSAVRAVSTVKKSTVKK